MVNIKKILGIMKSDGILVVSGIAALVSSLIVTPSIECFTYIDFKVLAILFCLMLIIAGVREIGALEVLAQKLVLRTKNIRMLSLTLTLFAFFSSMLITNDVALITLIPFTVAVLSYVGKGNLIFLITMQTVAANLGSMLTPIGNPQNLFLYSFFNIEILEFFNITTPIVMLGLVLITLITMCIRNSDISVRFSDLREITNYNCLIIYTILFIICILSVLGLISYVLMFVIVTAAILLVNKEIIKKIDYSLLLTFIFFFIFVGNIGQFSIIIKEISSMIHGREILLAVTFSQLISNVPAAILLSSFTKNYELLIAGTNIGGLGTLIASLASLISFKIYLKTDNSRPIIYITIFTFINVLLLIILITFSLFWYK